MGVFCVVSFLSFLSTFCGVLFAHAQLLWNLLVLSCSLLFSLVLSCSLLFSLVLSCSLFVLSCSLFVLLAGSRGTAASCNYSTQRQQVNTRVCLPFPFLPSGFALIWLFCCYCFFFFCFLLPLRFVKQLASIVWFLLSVVCCCLSA